MLHHRFISSAFLPHEYRPTTNLVTDNFAHGCYCCLFWFFSVLNLFQTTDWTTNRHTTRMPSTLTQILDHWSICYHTSVCVWSIAIHIQMNWNRFFLFFRCCLYVYAYHIDRIYIKKKNCAIKTLNVHNFGINFRFVVAANAEIVTVALNKVHSVKVCWSFKSMIKEFFGIIIFMWMCGFFLFC